MATKSKATKKASKSKTTKATKKKAFTKPDVPFNVFDNAVIVQVSCRKPGNSRRMNVKDVEVDMDKSMLRAYKTLLDSPELKNIERFDVGIYNYMSSQQITSKSSLLLQRGNYLIPLVSIEKVLERLKTEQSERQLLVDEFIDNYEQRKNEARQRLRDQYDEKNYLSVDAIKREFSFTFGVKAEHTPKSLESISSALFREELKKAQEQSKSLAVDISNTLRQGMKAALLRLLNALQPKDDGKRRKLHDSNIENLMTFLDTFSAKNIVQDEDLANVVNNARKIIKGEEDASILAQKLRTDDAFRQNILQQFEKIEKQMEELVIVEDSRDIILDDLD